MSGWEALAWIAAGAYFAFFLILSWKWHRIGTAKAVGPASTKFSVVVAVRDEAANLPATLDALANQAYPPSHYEVIFVDDHSTDGTAALITNHREYPTRFRYLRLPKGKAGKKAAVTYGIAHARHPYIALTDGDCRPHPQWLASLAPAAADAVFLSGPIAVEGRSVTARVLALEQWGLVAAGAAMLESGHPTMVNGGNMAFPKHAFETAGGYRGIEGFAAGDDELLAHRIIYRTGGRARFVKARGAVVATPPPPSFRQWWHQRRRWAAAAGHYEYAPARWTARWTAAYHWLIWGAAAFGIAGGSFLPLSILIGAKAAGELMLLTLVLQWYGRLSLLRYYPLGMLYYLAYVPIISVWAIFGPKSYQWKGRTVQ